MSINIKSTKMQQNKSGLLLGLGGRNLLCTLQSIKTAGDDFRCGWKVIASLSRAVAECIQAC